MQKETKLRFVYIVEGCVAARDVDTYFYSCLPKVETEVTDLHTGRRVTDIPRLDQSISVTGRSTLLGATLAAVIKDYLQERKSRIVIEGTNKHFEYEGPNLQTDTSEIEAVIYNLTKDSGTDSLIIMSYHLPEPSQET